MIRLIWNLVVVHLREAVFRFRIVHLARLHRKNSESLNDADHVVDLVLETWYD